MNLDKRKTIAIQASRQVGSLLRASFGRPLKVKSKGERNLVTDVDKKADQRFIELIKQDFPEDGILSEESPDTVSGSGYRWIIDPIDGTHNFIHRINIFGTSCALEFKGEVVLGVIYMPCTDELYAAEKGKGAFCNGKRIAVSQRRLNEATLIYDSSLHLNKTKMLFGLAGLVEAVFNVRMFGCTVRSLSFVAEGKAETEIEFNDKVWDFAAGLLLVEEAGGKATDLRGRRWNTDSQGYIASNAVAHQEVLGILNKGV